MDFNYVVLLLDIYGDLLSPSQRKALDMRCNADMSLSEIAEELGGITRQSVAYSIRTGEKRLTELEDKLHLAERFKKLSKKLDYVLELAAVVSRDYPEDDRLEEIKSVLSSAKEEL